MYTPRCRNPSNTIYGAKAYAHTVEGSEVKTPRAFAGYTNNKSSGSMMHTGCVNDMKPAFMLTNVSLMTQTAFTLPEQAKTSQSKLLR